MTPEEQLDEARAKEAVREMEERNTRFSFLEAATIAARLARENWTPPEPVPADPDILAWREWYSDGKSHEIRESILAGTWDKAASPYLAGARMAREQERERAKPLVEYVRGYACPESEGADILAKYLGEA